MEPRSGERTTSSHLLKPQTVSKGHTAFSAWGLRSGFKCRQPGGGSEALGYDLDRHARLDRRADVAVARSRRRMTGRSTRSAALANVREITFGVAAGEPPAVAAVGVHGLRGGYGAKRNQRRADGTE